MYVVVYSHKNMTYSLSSLFVKADCSIRKYDNVPPTEKLIRAESRDPAKRVPGMDLYTLQLKWS